MSGMPLGSETLHWIKDTDSRILDCNQAALSSLGLDEIGAVQGHDAADFYPDDAEAYYLDDLEVIHTRKAKVGIIESLRTVSTKVVVQTRKIPLFDRFGRVVKLAVYARELGPPTGPAAMRKQFLRSLFPAEGAALQPHRFALDLVQVEVRKLPARGTGTWFELLVSSSGDPITPESGRRLLTLLAPIPSPELIHSDLVGQSVRLIAHAPVEWGQLLDSGSQPQC